MQQELEKLKGDKKIPLGILVKRVFHYLKPELFKFILAYIRIKINR